MFEAVCLPCIYTIVATLYRRQEQVFYFSFVTMYQGVGSVLGNLVDIGIVNMGNARGIAMWRWYKYDSLLYSEHADRVLTFAND